MILLVEEVPTDLLQQEVIVEETGKQKKYYIKGAYLEADVKNKNKRIYPKPIIEREVNKFIEEKISQRRALGELKHPDSIEVDPERASHLIEDLKMEKNIAYGKAVVLDTPMGKIVKSLIDEKVKLGVSSRGVGTLKESIVQPDYKLVTIDIVTDPSAPSAFVDGIMESTKEWIIKDGIITEKKLDELNNNINNIKNEKIDINEATLKIFKQFIDTLQESLKI
jgi:hypothetical protein